jgi:hypothetical protein
LTPKYRYQFYQNIYEKIPEINRESDKIGKELGTDILKHNVGLYTGSSSTPGPMAKYALNAIIEANKVPVLPLRKVEDRLREVVKDIWGDSYDAAGVATCEGALRVCFETLFAPPMMRKGEAYRSRYISLYGEDFDFMAFYGRPFPPKYKNLIGDRSAAAGELGVEGKSLTNLDSVIVKMDGARYPVHGVKYNPVPVLTGVDAEGSFMRVSKMAERQSAYLSGFETIGYDTPGYGYAEKDHYGVPKLKKLIGEFSEELDLPYLIDCASGVPSLGYSIKDVHADVMMWSMDKMVHAPTSGLIVGKEEAMVPIRKGLGLGGQRYGEVSSHSKGVYSLLDPGRDALVGQVAVLEVLRDEPDRVKRPIDDMHHIVESEFSSSELGRLLEGIIITKSYTMGGIEVNYSGTWDLNEFGIPIFTSEDLFSNTNAIMLAVESMGVYAPLIYSGNIFLGPGLGTVDEEGTLIKEKTILAVRSLVKSIELVCKHAGVAM